MKIFDRGEQRRTRNQEFGAGFAVEARYHQGDGSFGNLLVEHLADSAGQWFGKIGMAQRVLITGQRGDREGLLVFERGRHVELGNVDRFGARNVASHAKKARA
ncbi:hypothetical protein D9M72_411410 [compost metagenome]